MQIFLHFFLPIHGYRSRSYSGGGYSLFGVGDGLFNPSVNNDVVYCAEPVNLKSLVLDGLFVGTYANITVIHKRFLCKDAKNSAHMQKNLANNLHNQKKTVILQRK